MITAGHRDYEELLDGTRTILRHPDKYAPFVLGGASKRLWDNIDTLATRAEDAWRKSGYTEATRTNSIEGTRIDTKQFIIAGKPCEQSPGVDTEYWDDFMAATASGNIDSVRSLSEEMAAESQDFEYPGYESLDSAKSDTYAHMTNCTVSVHDSNCNSIRNRISSLLLTFNSSNQPGCVNTAYDTPGHRSQGKVFCNKPEHSPGLEWGQLISLQSKNKEPSEDPSLFSTPEDVATISTIIFGYLGEG